MGKLKVTFTPIVTGAFGTVTKESNKVTEGPGNKRTSGDHPNYSIIEIVQNIQKSPGDLRRLVDTQTPGKDR